MACVMVQVVWHQSNGMLSCTPCHTDLIIADISRKDFPITANPGTNLIVWLHCSAESYCYNCHKLSASGFLHFMQN